MALAEQGGRPVRYEDAGDLAENPAGGFPVCLRCFKK
jgi:hypothetical protein